MSTSPPEEPPTPSPSSAGPVLVDDTGLSIQAWNGLPGAIVVWFLRTVGPQGILGSDSGHRTYAQMTSEEKNQISHRRRAIEAMRNGSWRCCCRRGSR